MHPATMASLNPRHGTAIAAQCFSHSSTVHHTQQQSLVSPCCMSRYGLAIGYYCAWLVRVLMAATSPISWPIGKLLDFLLGSEHRALFR